MIFFLSRRYAFSRSERMLSRSVRAIVTIALSLVVVTVVMSVMDFLQNGRFESIRDTRSFDVTVEGRHKDELALLFPDAVVFEYGEGEALTKDGAYQVRYISSDYDGGLHLAYGDTQSLTVPYSLFRKSGGSVSLSMLKKGKAATVMKTAEYDVGGIYWTACGSEFDDSMIFLPMETADEAVTFVTAVKNVDADEAKKVLVEKGYTAVTWKEMEESLYAAFAMEKAMMYAVLSLLFVIIMVSMKQSIRIFVSSRAKETAELEILGYGKRSILLVTEMAFLEILAIGILSSIVLGKASLVLIERISRSSSMILDMTLHMPGTGFAFFSIFLLAFTVLCVMWENRKRNKKTLWEVIHAA
ncbi:MAG: ABC transporter permease [Candidatus Ornithospirochaeta sp.]